MAASANDQTRSIERFIRGAAANNSTTVSQQQQQWLQQVFQTPSSTTTTLDFTIDNSEHRNKNVSSIYDQQTYEDPYIPDTNFSSNSFLDLKDDKTTRHFIDAWEKEYNDGISSSHSNHKKKKSSSLSLSMYNNGLDENGSNAFLEIGMMSNSNSVSWMNNSPPGGPLGEALCLGNASTRRCNSNTNSSSCEDGSQALNFIG